MHLTNRRISSTFLLAIILPIIFLAPFHHHEEPLASDISCDACAHHQPHPGHLSEQPGTHDCLICQLLNNAFVSLNLDWNLAQNHFYAAGGTETATPAYLLLGASAGTDLVVRGKKRLSLYIIASNLTDQDYMPHLSRLKYMGIANMGRNVAMKLIVPF